MGYNADLYARQPIQFDIVGMRGGKHYFVRDRDQKLHPCKAVADWPKLEDGFYIILMYYAPGGSYTSNYTIHGHRRLHGDLGQVRRANAELYELMLLRDAAMMPIMEDHIFRDLGLWVTGETPVLQIPSEMTVAHEYALALLATGADVPEAQFIATQATSTLADFLIYSL
jgi:hypothetical protein